jgi:hypothetical protein
MSTTLLILIFTMWLYTTTLVVALCTVAARCDRAQALARDGGGPRP